MAKKQKIVYEEEESSEESYESYDEEEDDAEERSEEDDEDESAEEESDEENLEDESAKIALIRKLIEPFDKEQLITIFTEAAATNPSIVEEIVNAAANDPVHRKVFVHGLGWDATNETLISVFKQYGEIEDCRVIMDKATGKTKGYGFIVFATRAGARKALKQQKMMVGSRMVSCNLAAFKPGQSNLSSNSGERKLYIGNVAPHMSVEKLLEYFAKYGEIEEGPLGLDKATGKFRGYAIIVYKTVEGFKKAMEEPSKLFEGQMLLCSKAVVKKSNPYSAVVGVSGGVGAANGGVAPSNLVPPGNVLLPAYVVGLNQGQTLNPTAVLMGQNPALGVLSPVMGVGSSMIQTQNKAGTSAPSVLSGGIGGQQGLNMVSPNFVTSYHSQAGFKI